MESYESRIHMRSRHLQLALVFLTFLTFEVSAATFYVNLNSISPVPPYADWSTAATNIQDAVDASSDGDLILVTNGVYQAGGRIAEGFSLTNRLVMDKAVTVQSVNGPAVTVIQGYQDSSGGSGGNDGDAIRCVFLTNGTTLTGFTLTNGATFSSINGGVIPGDDQSGGGIFCTSSNAVVSNCVLAGNTAFGQGGGICGGTANNCMITGNICPAGDGGGAALCILDNSVLTNNSAFSGGGGYSNTLSNCTLIANSAGFSGGGAFGCALSNCTLIGNSVSSSLVGGGGASSSTLNSCMIVSNSASVGGGVSKSTLNGCTLAGNTAGSGGGANSSTLSSCTLSNNSAVNGGGASLGALNDCILSGNRASELGGGAYSNILNNCTLQNNFANSGAGASGCKLNDCLVLNNSASAGGGGAHQSTLNNCDLAGNSANLGGGAYESTMNNCIAFYNVVGAGSNYFGGTLNYCCTQPFASNGVANISNEPDFVDLSGGDFHLQSNSPCINSGNNAYVTNPADLNGDQRIVGGTVDIGAYEYQTPVSMISYAWLQQYGLPIDVNTDTADPDGDGMNNYREWIAGTNPTNALSVLKMLSPIPTNNPAGLIVSWQSVNNRTYFLQKSINLGAQRAFVSIQSNIVGQAGTTSYTDTNDVLPVSYFYRVGVQH
jgi:hypothetical protein